MLLLPWLPLHHTWVPRNKKKGENPYWKRRAQNQHHTVGRVRHVPPSMECKELFHFRLLLNTRKGPRSFEDLRTFVDDDGNKMVPFKTYHEAAFHMGLIQDDKEWELLLEESSVVVMPGQIRSLFVIILTHGLPMNPKVLWDKYKKSMSDDFRFTRIGRRHDPSSDPVFTDDDYNDALLDIESQLQSFPQSKTEDYGLPPTRDPPTRVDPSRMATEVREALNFNLDDEKTKQDALLSTFNDEQTKTFNEINESVLKDEGKCFFLKSAGGCGKTTVVTALLHAARARGDITIVCTSSGIAATLLPKGQTAHSAFKIPIEGLCEHSTCNIGGLSGRAELLRRVKFIVWDEAFMVHRYGFEAVARTM